MTQSPVFPTLMPNLEFIEHYIDSLENLPLDVQRYVSQIREYDLLYRNKLDTIGRYLCLYQNEPSGPSKRKYLNKIQKCLIKSQHYGDEKLSLISQIVELVDSRSQQLSKDAETQYSETRKEEEKGNSSNNINSNNRVKMEKKTIVVEKPLRSSIYEKPKRVRRVRVMDKDPEKSERINNPSRSNNKTDYDEEDEPMEEDEEIDVKPKKESKKKERESKVREKEKEKGVTIKEEKEERKDEKKSERKEKSSGKVTKKANNKQITSKLKKKKKKEKEVLPEDIPMDPDEPTYCICNRISYGDMIGCDNQDCKIEWFHFDCVNLTHKPKGKWYCPRCATERKEKGKK